MIHLDIWTKCRSENCATRAEKCSSRVARGERLVVTRDGHAVAELRPFGRLALSASLLTERWSKLPKVNPERLRSDIDGAIDSRL